VDRSVLLKIAKAQQLGGAWTPLRHRRRAIGSCARSAEQGRACGC